ncbi:MAG: hypothetical protein LH473_10420 [Chitinophagales bacterium]|nr:hypothetical protein [Chitinophagales bacterium]
MKIYAIGEIKRIDELKLKLGSNHEIIFSGNENDFDKALAQTCDAIFDLNADERSNAIEEYSSLSNKLIIVCAVKKTLGEIISENRNANENHFVGMNCLPTFVNRPLAEVSFLNEVGKEVFSKFAAELKWNWNQVKDETGMVTPRVICMIINEACFSFDEGVASMEDIDKAMKLGTNYPWGPFEWCDRIGIKNIYETLEAIGKNSNDDRYTIAPLLKTKYLKNEAFTF